MTIARLLDDSAYRSIIGTSRDGFLLIENSGKIVDANAACCALFGSRREEMLCQSVTDLGLPALLDRMRLGGDEGFDLAVSGCANDGTALDLEISARALPGNGQCWACFIRNVTDLRRHERETRRLRDELSAVAERHIHLLEVSNDLIWEIDTHGVYTYVGPQSREVIGYEPAEIIGRSAFELMPPDEACRVRQIFEVIVRERKPVRMLENTMVHKDGHHVIMETNGVPLLAEDGTLLGYRGMDRDITSRKMLEEQLIASARQAAVGKLAAGIAHEFNNVLASIGVNAQIIEMQEEELAERIRPHLDPILHGVKRGKKIVSDMMGFARPKRPVKERFLIRDVIRAVLAMQGQFLKVENITVSEQYAGVAEVVADRGQLEQVFLNLVINARHAIKPKGGGTITVSIATARYDDKEMLKVEVADDGIGMHAEVQEQIFTPFYTTKGGYSSSSTTLKGSGLGLAVTNEIVRMHGGTISVTSEVGTGTTFMLLLPLGDAAVISDTIPAPPTRTKEQHDVAGMRVLVADDEESIRDSMRALLSARGCLVTVAHDGAAALSAFRDAGGEFDAIVVDHMMPKLSGDQVIRGIREMRVPVPIIMATGRIDEQTDESICREVHKVLQKPFDVTEMIATLADIKRYNLEKANSDKNQPNN